eukprot:gene5815-6403_t
MSSRSTTKYVLPPKPSKGISRPSPRRGSKYIPSRPDLPLPLHSNSLATATFDVEYDPHSSILHATRITDVNRVEVKRLEESIDQDLHRLYLQEQRHEMSELVRCIEQVKVLEGAIRELSSMIRKHCSDQADLLDKIWSSTADLFASVCQSLSDRTQDMESQLIEKTYQVKHWKEKAEMFKVKFYEATQNSTTSHHHTNATSTTIIAAMVDPSHIRQLEEEILLKDKELMEVQKTIVNLSIWFPRFSKFGGSILSRFLPPVMDEEEFNEEEEEEEEEQKEEETKQGIESQMEEVMKIIHRKQLAQDYLLKDLKRLEHLGIGLNIILGIPPPPASNTSHSASYTSSVSNSPTVHNRGGMDMKTPLRKSMQGSSFDEGAALSLGLFNSPQIATSFSATNGMEYMLKAPSQSFSGQIPHPSHSHSHGQQSHSHHHHSNAQQVPASSHHVNFEDISTDDQITQAAARTALAYQASTQANPSPNGQENKQKSHHRRRREKKKKGVAAVKDEPTTALDSPGASHPPLFTAQEFYRLQGRKFSTMTSVKSDYYEQQNYLSKQAPALNLPVEKNDNDRKQSKEEEETNKGDDDLSDDSSDYSDENEEIQRLRTRLKETLEQLQAMEVLKDREKESHEHDVAYYDDVVKQLKSKQTLLRKELKRVTESSNTMTKALPSMFYMQLPINQLHVKLQGTVVIKLQRQPTSQSIQSQSVSSWSLEEIGIKVDRFFSEFVVMLDHCHAHAQQNTASDHILDSWHELYLGNILNGQSMHTLNVPLLGVKVLLTDSRERRCLFSLFNTHYFEQAHQTILEERIGQKQSPKDALKDLLRGILTMLVEEKESLSLDPIRALRSENNEEINADVLSDILNQFTPRVALLQVFRCLFGADQLSSLSKNMEEEEEKDKQVGRNPVADDILRYNPSFGSLYLSRTGNESAVVMEEEKGSSDIHANTDRSSIPVGTISIDEPQSAIGLVSNRLAIPLDSIHEEESWIDRNGGAVFALDKMIESISLNQQSQQEPFKKENNETYTITVSPRAHYYSDDEEIESARYNVSLNAIKSIEAFDIYLQCFKAFQEFFDVTPSSLQDVLIPITTVESLIRRAFTILSLPVGVVKLNNNNDNKVRQPNHNNSLEPWWRYVTNDTVMLLKQHLQRHRSTIPANSDLEEMSEGVYNQDQPIIPTIPAPYFIYYSFRAVDRMRKPLTMILNNMYRFIHSLLPDGPSDSLFPSLLSYLLLCSPLLTHRERLVETTGTGEEDGQQSAAIRTVDLEPFHCSVPLSLLHELRVLHSNELLSDKSFADTVLRAGIPGLVCRLSPILLSSKETRTSPRSRQQSKQSKGGVLINEEMLGDLGHSKAVADLAKLARDSSHHSNSLSQDQNYDEKVQAKVRNTLMKTGIGYLGIALSIVSEMKTEWQRVYPLRSPRNKQKKSIQQPSLSELEECIVLRRFLFPKNYHNQEEESKQKLLDDLLGLHGSDFLRRLVAHTRLCFDLRLQHSVPVGYLHCYFTLVALLFSFGHVRHARLLSWIDSLDDSVTVRDFANSNEDHALSLFPGLSKDWDIVDAKAQEKFRSTKAYYLTRLCRRVFLAWKQYRTIT